MIDREQAEALVTGEYAGAFTDATFMIGAVWEDADFFAVTYGAREWLVDGDEGYLIIGAWPIFVAKDSGALMDPPGVTHIFDAQVRLGDMNLLVDYTVQ